MPVEKRITCDDGCTKVRTFPDDLAGTEVVHIVAYLPGGTEDVWFIKPSHAKRWLKDLADLPDPTPPPATT